MSHHTPFHVVEMSPWPITASLSLMSLMVSLTFFMKNGSKIMIMLSMLILMLVSFQWWRDISRESTFQGHHTKLVTKGLKIGMLLFILSEIMFFLSFFWAFFHSSLSPSIQIGAQWPPIWIEGFNPTLIPLLNTTILISSGITITWTHHSMINFKFKNALKSMLLTIILGIYFTILQMWEYYEAPFTISDSIYGASFFLSTGFHGLHVIVGTTFLIVIMIRMINFHFSSFHHLGFEAAAWYWHFVDVVWLFLYSTIYWWGM